MLQLPLEFFSGLRVRQTVSVTKLCLAFLVVIFWGANKGTDPFFCLHLGTFLHLPPIYCILLDAERKYSKLLSSSSKNGKQLNWEIPVQKWQHQISMKAPLKKVSRCGLAFKKSLFPSAVWQSLQKLLAASSSALRDIVHSSGSFTGYLSAGYLSALVCKAYWVGFRIPANWAPLVGRHLLEGKGGGDLCRFLQLFPPLPPCAIWKVAAAAWVTLQSSWWGNGHAGGRRIWWELPPSSSSFLSQSLLQIKAVLPFAEGTLWNQPVSAFLYVQGILLLLL